MLTPISVSILLAVADEPRHGYAILKQIDAETKGRLVLEAGTLYAAIKRMQDEGLLEVDGRIRAGDDSRRRYYRLTPAGRRTLAAECDRLDDVLRVARLKQAFAPARRSGR
jgi:DNA-binding PadR family transcriptional regulator